MQPQRPGRGTHIQLAGTLVMEHSSALKREDTLTPATAWT